MGAFTEKWQTQPSWVFTKQGIVIERPNFYYDENQAVPWRNKGPYYPQVHDLSMIPNFPGDKVAITFTSDHDYGGYDGVHLYYLKDGVFVNYDDGVAAGDFDYLATKPAANPIYRDDVIGQQTETFHARYINGQWVGSYQQENIGSHQSTLYCTSDDFVNWARGGMLLDYDKENNVGDGHSGYLTQALSRIASYPFKYFGTALHGGGGGYMQVCGSDDPVNMQFVTTAITKYNRGRVVESMGLDNEWSLKSVMCAPEMIRQIGREYYIPGPIGEPQQGLISTVNQMHWLPMDDTATVPKGVPQEMIPLGGSGEPDEKGLVSLSMLGDDCYYQSLNFGSDSRHTVMKATINKNGPLIQKQRLPLDIPFDCQKFRHSFKYGRKFPAHLELITAGATAVYNDLYVTYTIPDGDHIILSAGTGFIPAQTDYAEVFLKDFRCLTSTFENKNYWIGFVDSKGKLVDATSYLVLKEDPTDHLKILIESSNSGGIIDTQDCGDDTTAFGASSIRKQIGIRWFPKAGRAYQLEHSKIEYTRVTQSSIDALDMNETYYPVIGVSNVSGDGSTVTFAMDEVSFDFKIDGQARPIPEGTIVESTTIPLRTNNDPALFYTLDEPVSFDGSFDISFRLRKLNPLSSIGISASSSGSRAFFVSNTSGSLAMKVGTNYKTFFVVDPSDAEQRFRIVRNAAFDWVIYKGEEENETVVFDGYNSSSSVVFERFFRAHTSETDSEGYVRDIQAYDADRNSGGNMVGHWGLGVGDPKSDRELALFGTNHLTVTGARWDLLKSMTKYQRGDGSKYWLSDDHMIQYDSI